MTAHKKDLGRTSMKWAPLVAICASLVLAACAAAPARVADKYYDLQPRIGSFMFGTNASIRVDSVTVKGLQSGRPLVIQAGDAPVYYEEVRGHLWHVAPSTMLQRAFVDALSEASGDATIGTSDTLDMSDMRLKLTVTKLIIMPNEAAAIDIEAVLKNKSGDIILVQDYQGQTATRGAGYEGAVLAMQDALADVIGRLAADIRQAL